MCVCVRMLSHVFFFCFVSFHAQRASASSHSSAFLPSFLLLSFPSSFAPRPAPAMWLLTGELCLDIASSVMRTLAALATTRGAHGNQPGTTGSTTDTTAAAAAAVAPITAGSETEADFDSPTCPMQMALQVCLRALSCAAPTIGARLAKQAAELQAPADQQQQQQQQPSAALTLGDSKQDLVKQTAICLANLCTAALPAVMSVLFLCGCVRACVRVSVCVCACVRVCVTCNSSDSACVATARLPAQLQAHCASECPDNDG